MVPDAFEFSLDTETGTEYDAAAIGGTLASALIQLLIGAIVGAACFRAVSAGYLGSPTTWQESLAFVGRRLPALLLVLVLTWLATGLGLVACIVPGVWLWVALYFSQSALLFEDVRGRQALRRSFRLVRG